MNDVIEFKNQSEIDFIKKYISGLPSYYKFIPETPCIKIVNGRAKTNYPREYHEKQGEIINSFQNWLIKNDLENKYNVTMAF